MSRVSELYRNHALHWWHYLRRIDERLRSLDEPPFYSHDLYVLIENSIDQKAEGGQKKP